MKALLNNFIFQSLSVGVETEVHHTKKMSLKLVNMKISKQEFAEYLKLKVDSLFVQNMFGVADADDDGMVSFREFLDIVVLFTKGIE